MMSEKLFFYGLLCMVLFTACKKDDPVVDVIDPEIVEEVVEEEEELAVYDDTPFDFKYGALPDPELPANNPLTVEGVKLGRMLFYEEMLSKGNAQSCASCHSQTLGFSDSARVSLGVEELPGKRQSMPVFNMAWHKGGFFWDGRVITLIDQAIQPIKDPLEMNETLENVEAKLQDSKMYRDQFIRAFDDDEITWQNMALALEQFMLSIVSVDSKYDKFLAGELQLTESEERGRALFFGEFNPDTPESSGANCAHCHSGLNFENNSFRNNGLDNDWEFEDIGFQFTSNRVGDRAKFKVPSLRNVAVTAPYMHDGRFETLEQVIDHYNAGIKVSATVDPAILNTRETGLLLSEQDKLDLVNFLHTLTDETFLTNPDYQSPF